MHLKHTRAPPGGRGRGRGGGPQVPRSPHPHPKPNSESLTSTTMGRCGGGEVEREISGFDDVVGGRSDTIEAFNVLTG